MSYGRNRRNIFGRLDRRPPWVPDPGQRVRVLSPDGRWREGFRAVTGPLSDDIYSTIVWLAEEEEWETATLKRRRPVTMPWPLEKLSPSEEEP